MRKRIWEKQIPTLFGILLIIIGILTTSQLAKSELNFFGIASPAETPNNMRISNISDSSFTVSYTTSSPVLGSISLGENQNLGTNITDLRDQQEEKLTPRRTHSIVVQNLKPSTKYFFSIISGQTTYLNNDIPFEVKTGPLIQTQPSAQEPLVGKIILEDGTNPSEAIVYFTASNGQTLSTLVKNDGTYLLPLNSMRTQNLSSYFSFEENSKAQMLVLGVSHESNIITKIVQKGPMPLITLSKNYDFTINGSPVASISAVGFPYLTVKEPDEKNTKILTPKNDEYFSDQKPLFKGIASPGAKIKISIHSKEELTTEIKADTKGNWSYRPNQSLSPGSHTISVTAPDQFGILKTITRSFTVFAQGSQVIESATPSATPKITVSPTPISLVSPSPTPTITPSPSPTLTPVLTPTPKPTSAGSKGGITKEEMPAPGTSSGVFSFVGILAVAIIGIILFFVTRGGTPSV